MSTDKSKANADKSKSADKPGSKPADKPAAKATAAPTPAVLPPLFRKIDWLALLVAFGVIWIIYFLTLAPELTLEDSGELCTGSFYAGIPHPPGYPFWAIYSWLWTVLLPIGNVAWRVEVGEATAAAMACGMVALMVSRGSSMLMEGLENLKELPRKSENLICLVCGITSGLLLGLGNTMWSESVAINRISLFGAPWVMAVMVCIMRWLYSPRQWRYLFCAMFFFGLCATIHQTLICAAMGIEFTVAWAHPRLGRVFCAGNVGIFLAAWVADLTHVTTVLQTADMLRYIFFGVGLISIVGYFVCAVYTKATAHELAMDGGFAACALLAAYGMSKGGFFYFLALIGFGVWVYEIWNTRKRGWEWMVAMACLGLWVMGVAFYLYEPIAGMTNPPMEWGYPRTYDGFLHALSRGQYEKVNPTDIFHDPARFMMQLGLLMNGIVEEYNWILLLVTIIPFVFFMRLQRREKSWLACIFGIYLCIGPLLVILMNPSEDRASVDLHRVFFASSHGVIAVSFGMGLSLICAYMVTQYQNFRQWGLAGGGIAAVLGLFALWQAVSRHYIGIDGQMSVFEMPGWIAKAFQPHQYGLPIFGALILAALPFAFLAALYVYKDRAPLTLALGVFAAMPLCSGLAHWGTSEQRNHWFGYWFGHDMFTPPFGIYPEMARDAILFGGTDPGRFCPTYMIFCESFIPHRDQPKEDQHFDRRDVYIITQNALADPTYLEYIRAQYNRSTQVDTPFFQEALRSANEKELNYTTNFLARAAYKLLDEPMTKFGANVEARRRREGVYPREEIYCPSGQPGYRAPNGGKPTEDDSSKAFSDYMQDAQQRLQHDMIYTNEPKQIKPGEDVHQGPDNRVSVSGQVAVMSINGLLTKDIFDHNPKNEFYVEESFPLDWMYPYETPFGIIMKINRQPLAELSDDDIKKDHEFWSRYSDRTVGNWITYDTSLKDIASFAERVYLRHDMTGFKGNAKFIRDDQAQKAFSKLRSSIGGMYDWRFHHPHSPADQQRMLKEADFAYKQSFVYCPYSPEAVFRYVQLLVNTGRLEDALIVAQTCHELDPNNDQVERLYLELKDAKNRGGMATPAAQMPNKIEDFEKQVAADSNNFQAIFNLAAAYAQTQQKDRAIETLDKVLKNPKADVNAVVFLAQAYQQLQNLPKLETTLERLTKLEPDSPEAWCDLASMKAILGKNPEAMAALRMCAEENRKRLAANPKATDMMPVLRGERFKALQSLPEYQQLVNPK